MCQPRELLVEILQEYPEEVEHIFIPSCVVLTRCAGCCNDEIMQCTPTSSYNITMEVSTVVCKSSSFGVLCRSDEACPLGPSSKITSFINDMSKLVSLNGQLKGIYYAFYLFPSVCYMS